jgi:hypothetical protein
MEEKDLIFRYAQATEIGCSRGFEERLSGSGLNIRFCCKTPLVFWDQSAEGELLLLPSGALDG